MSRLLVVHHSPTRTLRALTDQVLAGTHDPGIEGVEVVVHEALDFATGAADADTMLGADGYVLGTSANFGYMSGALKHVFDSTFLAIGGALDDSGGAAGTAGATRGRPYGVYVHGRYDTTGALRSITSITGALGWKQAARHLEVLGDPDEQTATAAYELGGSIAALLAG